MLSYKTVMFINVMAVTLTLIDRDFNRSQRNVNVSIMRQSVWLSIVT
jgi:hypothetical protein